MVSSASLAAGPADLARAKARVILSEGRFRRAPVPRPLHGVLHEIGRLLEAPLNGLQELVSDLAVVTPGGSVVVWAALAALVLLASGFFAARGARRALDDPARGTGGIDRLTQMSASELEREAAAAERAGRYADALRLGFRAGLMRLAETGRVADAPSLVNAQVSRALRSQRFDVLARRFDEIAYGGRVAQREDVELARSEWGRLLRSERAR
jgi:hypothetical protein